MRITAIAATTNGGLFTKDALERLAQSSERVPVTMNFDYTKKIGQVIKAEVVNDELVIVAEVNADISGMYLVPGYRGDDFESVTMGVTISPQDQTNIS